jgi:aminoglycoside phosphotransferase (APT) family kinase protein
MFHEHAALDEVVHREHVAPVAHRRDRHAEQLAQLADLGDGVRGQPRAHHRLGERAVAPAPAHGVEALVGRQVVTSDHRREVGPLLRREHAQADPAVLARHDLGPVAAARHDRH